MPYLGNKPVNNFVSFAKQDITGNGGTSYSLDYPVTGANDIDLYINNVRQEPTEAYSCSGSTLTLTEAVSSSDDIYAIFRGRALQTANHPSDSALEASSANISGDTTLGGNLTVNIDQDSTLLVKDAGTNAVFITASTGQELYFGANNEYAFRIKNDGTKDVAFDNGGRVTMPYQPAFNVRLNTSNSTAPSGIDTVKFNQIVTNVGSHYSNSTGRFTAPVSGFYQINLSMYFQNGTNYVGSMLQSGDGTIYYNFSSVGPDVFVYTSQAVYLNQNDFLFTRTYCGGSTTLLRQYSYFSGYLIG